MCKVFREVKIIIFSWKSKIKNKNEINLCLKDIIK